MSSSCAGYQKVKKMPAYPPEVFFGLATQPLEVSSNNSGMKSPRGMTYAYEKKKNRSSLNRREIAKINLSSTRSSLARYEQRIKEIQNPNNESMSSDPIKNLESPYNKKDMSKYKMAKLPTFVRSNENVFNSISQRKLKTMSRNKAST